MSDHESVSHSSELIPWCSSQRLHGGRADCLRKCMLALEDTEIFVEHGHAEGSIYQFEISTGPLEPLAAVDAFYASRDIIKRTALNSGYQATFIPRPMLDSSPSGLHLNLSVHSSTASYLKSSEGRVEANVADMFLAGILTRPPALCAISMPSSQSYLRGATYETMGEFVAWGKSNQSVALNERARGYWEVRSLDCSVNVHLAVAAYIGAGILGLEKNEALPSKDPVVAVETLHPKDRSSLGITKRLPASLEEALLELQEQKAIDLESVLGCRMLELCFISSIFCIPTYS
ncbi:glutamine synthetase/guanido kinase [Mytilinidion resinicola]|uniref:Glutamine synthetase/guanido kinase n=1 Tax=Mytilinidion resinicola TaxID=574789 RepID=A0A6A6Z0T8_9PEZI|nr:glutamine synthetase/guanido kinase [Mytilinidion resinicola]KAF2814408.1 glutamine synthetase/guanido kinase [Mytilinidion resinicola]